MITKLSSQQRDFNTQLSSLLSWESVSNQDVLNTVEEIINTIRSKGDKALIDYSIKFDGVKAKSMADLMISQEELEKSFNDLSDKQKNALSVAAERIKSYHLKQNQQKQRVKLSENKKKRSKTIASLGKKLLSDKQQLAKLKADEANLTAALQKLTELIRAKVDLTGLSKLKRKLTWPVKGRLLRSFGSKKQGYLKWKGVLLGAPIGRQVQTIHNGTVLFSDWLKGYGLLTVIDHGNGYMSLYAHNQTLLKSVGDQVETGEPIALVGQSGGQDRAGLYFEIRHQGKAVNPKLWCR